MWFKEKFFKYAAAVLIVLVIVFFIGQLDFFFKPFKQFIAILFFPLLVSGFLYYLLRPLVNLGVKLKMPRPLAIIVVFLIVITVFTLVGVYAGALIGKQLNQLMANLPGIIDGAKAKGTELVQDQNLGQMFTGKIQEQATDILKKIVPVITGSLFGAVTTITGIATALVMVPFILFYLLRDDRIFTSGIARLIPQKYRNDAEAILEETDNTLAVYIKGQAIVALVIGVMMFIGYTVFGINYSLILAFFAFIASFIPMFGSIIGVIPAILVGLAESPVKAFEVLILMFVVQQLEGNLISPYLIGNRLKIHPLTLILLFLVAASLYGFVGMLIVVPVYAVMKVLIKNAMRIYRLRVKA